MDIYKPFLRTVEKGDSVLIVDHTIFEKPYTAQSEIRTPFIELNNIKFGVQLDSDF